MKLPYNQILFTILSIVATAQAQTPTRKNFTVTEPRQTTTIPQSAEASYNLLIIALPVSICLAAAIALIFCCKNKENRQKPTLKEREREWDKRQKQQRKEDEAPPATSQLRLQPPRQESTGRTSHEEEKADAMGASPNKTSPHETTPSRK